MWEYRVGQIVESLAGHDKKQIYIVKHCEDEFVYLVDGKIRKLDRPKKKKKKHVRFLSDSSVEIGKATLDSEIRKSLKAFMNGKE